MADAPDHPILIINIFRIKKKKKVFFNKVKSIILGEIYLTCTTHSRCVTMTRHGRTDG